MNQSNRVVGAHGPAFLTPHLNILVGTVDFTKRVHAVHVYSIYCCLIDLLDIEHSQLIAVYKFSSSYKSFADT